MAKWTTDWVREAQRYATEEVTIFEWAARIEKIIRITTASLDAEKAAKATDEYIRDFIVKSLEEEVERGLYVTLDEVNEWRASLGIEPYVTKAQRAAKERAAKSQDAFNSFCKPQPKPEGAKRQCPKCGGSGKFVLYMENGIPKSNTGYTCYKCNGKGWL